METLRELKGVAVIADDILVYGRGHSEAARVEHDQNLECLLERAQANGLKADPHKVQAIQDMQSATIVKDLQHFLGMLQQYDITVKYKKGKELYLADTLSSTPVQEDLNHVHDSDQEHASACRIQQCTITDGGLQALATTIKEGWPERNSDAPERVREYWHYRDELNVYDDTIFRGERLLVLQ
ncbi:hypothetical protein PR048_019846 [Dryococelus australis]|uniref:Reverse transcriptase domain-containing protein n=1 Tax=Dryococelus australis TaxID=614101 RepID=A0ABQ9H4L9_9NEOP|nr:hypothetical protein PR048_019846 [Dryococelus australis]